MTEATAEGSWRRASGVWIHYSYSLYWTNPNRQLSPCGERWVSDSPPPSTSRCVLDTFAVRKAMQATRRDLCGWGMGYPVVPSLVMRWLCTCACWSACLPVLSVRRSILTYLLVQLFLLLDCTFGYHGTAVGYEGGGALRGVGLFDLSKDNVTPCRLR